MRAVLLLVAVTAFLRVPSTSATHVPAGEVSWACGAGGSGQKGHPDARMLQKVHSSYRDPYAGYYEICSIGVSGGTECDVDGLHPKAVVVGVDHEDVAVAYPVEGVQAAGGVVVHEVGGQRFVVSVGPGGASSVFDADGHDFNRSGDAWVDEDGNRWDLADGARTDGTEDLSAVDHIVSFWFAWRDHHPNTELWQTEGGGGGVGSDGGASPAPGLLVVAAVLAAVALSRRRP